MAKYILRAATRSQSRTARFFLWIYAKLLFPETFFFFFFYYVAIRVVGFNFKDYIATIPARPNIGEPVRYLLSRPFYYFIFFFFAFSGERLTYIG